MDISFEIFRLVNLFIIKLILYLRYIIDAYLLVHHIMYEYIYVWSYTNNYYKSYKAKKYSLKAK